MNKAVSRGQALELVSRFSSQINWKELDGDQIQEKVVNLSPEEFGRRFTNFLKVGCPFIFDGQKLIITKKFDPTKFIGEGYTTWRGPIDGKGLSGEEEIDLRSLALTEIDPAKFIFETCIGKGGDAISGVEKLRRLKKEKPKLIRFAGNVFLSLWLDYQANKENSVLEWLYKNLGVTFMDFPGQIFRSPTGRHDVLYFYRHKDDGSWKQHCGWLDVRWIYDNPSVCYLEAA